MTSQLLPRLSQKLIIVIETLGKLLLEGKTQPVLVATGLLILGFWIFKQLAHSSQPEKLRPRLTQPLQLVTAWLIITAVAFAFYRGSTPEYYFLGIVPVLMLVLAESLLKLNVLKKSFSPILLIVGLFLIGAITTQQNYQTSHHFSVAKQNTALSLINQINLEKGVSEIVYDIEPVHAVGIKYLINEAQFTPAATGQKVHVIFPYTNGEYTHLIENNAAIWVEPN